MRENNSMKHIGKTITLPAVAAILLLAGCSREFKVDNGANFKTTSFDKFLWYKHVPDTVKAIITTEFAECEDLSGPLVLQLCNDDGKAVGPEIAQLWVNGIRSEDNTIVVDPSEPKGESEIWIVLNESQTTETRTFTWNLQIVDNPGLVKVNDREPATEPWVVNTTMNWKNVHGVNPVKMWTEIILFILLAVVFVWIVRVHFVIFPKFKVTQVKRIFVTIDENRKNIQGCNTFTVLAKAIVLSPQSRSQNFFSWLFTGKVVYIRISHLPGVVTLTPGVGKYQTKCDYDRKVFISETAGENDELKVVRPIEQEAMSRFSVEYYCKRR